MNKKLRYLLIIEIIVIICAVGLFLKPATHVSFDADSLSSEDAVVLEGIFDVGEKGLYADNSLKDSVIITTPLEKYHLSSYKVTVRYIANDATNTVALLEGNGRKATDDMALPAGDGELLYFSSDLSFFGSAGCMVTINYNGNGYLYVTGIDIEETGSFRLTLLLALIIIFILVDSLIIFHVFDKLGKVLGRIDERISPYMCEVSLSRTHYSALIIIFIVLAIMLRLWRVGFVPGNGAINNDEAFSGYEAWSMLNYGFDTHGYVNPVYLTVWGSGMSVLQSYVMMPFIALFGLSTFSVRIPSAILGIFTVIAFYRLFARREQDALSIIGLIAMAIIPWNVMTSRWGLDCDFYPAFVLFGTLFLLKVRENSKWFVLSMLFYGLSLYCYAAPWIVMPFLVAGGSIYMLIAGKCRWDKWWTVGIILLGVIAFPLLLFVAVNVGVIPEIRTGFISIPDLDFRGGEVGIQNAVRNLRKFFNVVVLQNDGLIWNSAGKIGIYYMISAIPGVIGMISSIRALVRKEEYRLLDGLMWIWYICGIILAVNIDNNVNRINIIHIPIIYFISLGIAAIVRLLYNSKARVLIAGIAGIYLFYFVWFVSYYFGSYSEAFGAEFDKGLAEAIEYAQSMEHDKIYVDASYPVVLLRAKVPTTEVTDPENNFWETHCTDEYKIMSFQNETPQEGDIYIGKTSDVTGYMEQYSLETAEFGYFTVGHY